MGAMDGVTMARKLRQDNQTVQIIFITGYADYISDGYEVDALHYLMKPIQEEKFFTVLDRAVTKLIKNEKFLNIISQGDVYKRQLSALFPNCLHLEYIVTSVSPKLATSGAATPYWMRFPLINLYALLGVPLVPPVHNQGVSSAPLQGHALWNIFLPTTGSFFVCCITDFFPVTAQMCIRDRDIRNGWMNLWKR